MGYSVVTTVLAAAASYDLTDLATVKDELGLKTSDTSKDTWLERAITQVSRAIARHTKRVFAPELVQDAFDIQQDPYPYQTPGGFAQLVLSRWGGPEDSKPLLVVLSVVQTLAPGAPATTQALVEGLDFRSDPSTGRLLRLNPFTGVGTSWEALPVTVIYLVGFGALVTETHTVPGTPFQVTVSQAATFSCDYQVSYASGVALARVTKSPAQGQYQVNAATGVYTLAAADAGQSLTFAYATLGIPEDLEGICLRLVTERFQDKDRNPALIQRDTPGVGTERFWFGGAPGQKGPFPPDIEGALDNYRMPVVV